MNRTSDESRIYDRICGNCGLTFGAHRCSDDACPEHEGRTDWPERPPTRFLETPEVRKVPYGTASRIVGEL